MQVRGLLISLKEAVVVVGILLGYLGGALWIEDVGGWRLMFGSALFPALIVGAGMFWLMESPRWLLLSGAPKAEVRTCVDVLESIHPAVLLPCASFKVGLSRHTLRCASV